MLSTDKRQFQEIRTTKKHSRRTFQMPVAEVASSLNIFNNCSLKSAFSNLARNTWPEFENFESASSPSILMSSNQYLTSISSSSMQKCKKVRKHVSILTFVFLGELPATNGSAINHQDYRTPPLCKNVLSKPPQL